MALDAKVIILKILKYVLKRVSFGSKDCTKELKQAARLASFCHLDFISDPLIASLKAVYVSFHSIQPDINYYYYFFILN